MHYRHRDWPSFIIREAFKLMISLLDFGLNVVRYNRVLRRRLGHMLVKVLNIQLIVRQLGYVLWLNLFSIKHLSV